MPGSLNGMGMRESSMRKSICYLFVSCLLTLNSAAAEYKVAVVAEGLEYPWSLAFLPNGEMLVTERAGRLRMIRDDDLVEYDVGGLPDIYVAGQGGLFDVLIDPDFDSNERVYISYSAGSGSSNSLQVISARLDGRQLVDVRNILDVMPTKNTPHHFGGRMAFLGDGTLAITSGDGFDYREQAQSLESMLGKVLRINTDGTVPADNPFVGTENARSEILSYGHRNPQAILWSQDGTLWMHEHGPKGGDELNLIVPGQNYGWPAVTWGMDYSGAYVSPFTTAEGMVQPAVYWVPSIAPSGMTEYQGDLFPEWKGSLFVAALAEKSVRRVMLNGHDVVGQETLFTELDERIRDVRSGPDGNLYLLTDSETGKVLRISPR